MENDRVPCFTVCPWHGLAVGDVVLYVKRKVHVDDVGRWSDRDEAGELLLAFKVEDVPTVELNAGLSAVSMRLETTTDARSDWVDKAAAEVVVVVRTLYKDGKYCMNHLFSRSQAIVRDLLACRPSELIALQTGSSFFLWSPLMKSSKNKYFAKQTLDCIKTSYVEVLRTWLQEIMGLSTKPVQCCQNYKCKPCKTVFHRYPLNLQAKSRWVKAMFGGSLICKHDPSPDPGPEDPES
ncbi:hypothetical protein CRENBAI_010179 [Crenichthys baileyi]|uniref:Uncharacterized protein n=1 Tax=Crenichthys baileyi TaxID=28760 RepID=A0AAV9S0Z0_9TELE